MLMARWWGDDVSAVAANVEAVAEATCRVPQGPAGMREPEVRSSRSGFDAPAVDRAMVVLQRCERFVASMARVDVDDDKTRLAACPDADVCRRPAAPPATDGVGGERRRMEPS